MGGNPADFVLRRACTCGPPPEWCLRPEEMVSHYGRNREFFEAPKAGSETELSVLRGRHEPQGAARAVRGSRISAQELAAASVRYASVGALRDAGFAVVHTPLSVKKPDHVSVIWPNDDPLNRQDVPWLPTVVTAFAACFNEVFGGE